MFGVLDFEVREITVIYWVYVSHTNLVRFTGYVLVWEYVEFD